MRSNVLFTVITTVITVATTTFMTFLVSLIAENRHNKAKIEPNFEISKEIADATEPYGMYIIKLLNKGNQPLRITKCAAHIVDRVLRTGSKFSKYRYTNAVEIKHRCNTFL